MLEIRDAVCGYRRGGKEKIVLDGISMKIEKGCVMCILGSNGIGKTTLFRSILGSLPLIAGSVLLDGQDLSAMKRIETARRIAYVPQSHTPPFPFTVRQIAVMGRTAHLGMFASPSADDIARADEALALMGISALADQPYTEISGGERQLVLIARAVAQEADYMIMDEPTSSLDFGNQVRVLEIIRRLAEDGRGIVVTTHFPDHVFMAASEVTVIRSRTEFCTGATDDVLTVEMMKEIYGIDTGILETVSPSGKKVRTVAVYTA